MLENAVLSKIVHEDRRILIGSPHPQEHAEFMAAIKEWGLGAKTISTPVELESQVQKEFFNIILLDALFFENGNAGLLEQIKKHSPYSKVVVVGINLLDADFNYVKINAADFFEAPVNVPLLCHRIESAMACQKTEIQYLLVQKELEEKKQELLEHRSQLEETTRQLVETNNALSVLAQNIERTRKETQNQIVKRIRTHIVPIVEKLQGRRGMGSCQIDLNLLSEFLTEITSDLSLEFGISSSLTPTELRIASLIKNGLTTEEISDYMFISSCTVKTHRRNIRKKLKLNNSKYNLRSFLQSKLQD